MQWPTSYASIASQGIPSWHNVLTLHNAHEALRESARENKQILIKIPDPKEAETIKTTTTEDLIAKIISRDWLLFKISHLGKYQTLCP